MAIPFLAAAAVKLSPIGAALKRIPRWAWIALAVIALLLLGSCVHSRKVKAFGKERYAAGVKDEAERIAAKALAIKSKADAASSKITQALKEKHDEEARAIVRVADSLRLRGPGRASCPGRPVVPGASGGNVAAGGATVSASTGLPVEDRIAVPFDYAVNQAEVCDLNRSEALSWREWWKLQSEAWAKIGADR